MGNTKIQRSQSPLQRLMCEKIKTPVARPIIPCLDIVDIIREINRKLNPILNFTKLQISPRFLSTVSVLGIGTDRSD